MLERNYLSIIIFLKLCYGKCPMYTKQTEQYHEPPCTQAPASTIANILPLWFHLFLQTTPHPALPKTPSYYNFCCWFFQVTSTLMYTNVNSVILTNGYSHITRTPVTMQNTFISPESSLMSPPSYSETATSLIFHFWLFLSGLELHINETILL